MKYKIVVDSCCELPDPYKKEERFQRIPLGLEVGDYRILDDDSFDQKEFLEKVAAYPQCPKSSCPSPERFMEAYHCEAEEVYVVTLSSHLSGSYNSAELGRNLYHEKYGGKKIHVVDSESASCGETQLAMRIMQYKEAGLSFEETVEKILTAAKRLFLEKGYERTTIQDIVDQLGGLTKGAVYHHFKSKEEIMDALGDGYKKACMELCVNAANCGIAWAHYWRGDEGFEWAIVDSKEIIPVMSRKLKRKLLGVSQKTLDSYGAVSPQTAMAMARRARVKSGADIAISVTGNAGPEPSEGKPVGLVYVGLDCDRCTTAQELHIQTMAHDGREYIREMAASRALYLALQAAKQLIK